MKKSLFILIICLILFSSFHFASAGFKSPDEPFKYNLMVPLPTSEGTSKQVVGIVDYIKTLYMFAMGIAGLAAMVMIIVAGFQWLTSTGNMSRVGQAKTRMTNAVLGLILLLGAYLILNTINPSLTRLKEPLIYFIDWTEPFDQTNVPGGGGNTDYCQDANGNKLVTTCRQYIASHYNDCEANPCGVSDTCYYNSVISFCEGCGANPPHSCGDYATTKGATSCINDVCHVSPTGCQNAAGNCRKK